MIKEICACLCLVLFLCTGWTAPSNTFQEPIYKEHIDNVLQEIYLEHYEKAYAQLRKHVPANSLYNIYFMGLIHMGVFNDLGDTSALSKAQSAWLDLRGKIELHQKNKTKPKDLILPLDLYYGLTLVQLSYIYQIKHQSIKSIFLGKKGIKFLRKQKKYVESICVFAIYEYYKQQLLEYFDWVPFVSGDSKKARSKLLQNYKKSPYLGNIMLNSLIWMYFDEGLYKEGLVLTDTFLKKYPNNRLFRSIRADLMYKLGRNKESKNLFEEIKKDYETLYETYPSNKCIKIPYLSILGNLARVNHELGNEKEKEKYLKIWFSKETKKVEKWLPKSLVEDLTRFEK